MSKTMPFIKLHYRNGWPFKVILQQHLQQQSRNFKEAIAFLNDNPEEPFSIIERKPLQEQGDGDRDRDVEDEEENGDEDREEQNVSEGPIMYDVQVPQPADELP